MRGGKDENGKREIVFLVVLVLASGHATLLHSFSPFENSQNVKNERLLVARAREKYRKSPSWPPFLKGRHYLQIRCVHERCGLWQVRGG